MKNAIEVVIQQIAANALKNQGGERDPENNPDYTDEDGLLCCGVCKKPKRTKLQFDGKELIVPCICDCRKKELEEEEQRNKQMDQLVIVNRLRNSSLMSNKYAGASFDAYLHRPENEKAYRIARNYVDRFQTMYEKNQGIIFYGGVGTGKTYTAACIANALLNNAVPVVMTSFVKILQDIFAGEMGEAEYLAIMNRARLLIVDDLGAERNTDYALEKVYNVIDSRIRTNKPMILTTNLTRKELQQPQDIRYHRIYDRILEVCYPVQLTGQSFRMAEAAQRHKDMRELMEG